MSALKFYWYKGCSTCRKAKAALDAAGVAYQEIDITTSPPAEADFKRWLKSGQVELKQLFNTSGEEYRKGKIGDRLKAGAGAAELLPLLAKNGRLVKRPILADATRVTVGFKDPAAILAVWKSK